MAKQIYYGAEAKHKLKEGIDAVANAVKSTLGPRGQNVLLQDGYDDNRITKDGVTVARNILLEDEVANAGASIIKKVANKTAADAGDGTTTSTVIAQAIIELGSRLIASGINQIDLKYGIDIAANKAMEYLKSKSIIEEGAEHLNHIATVSANGDEEIGKLVAKVITEVGKDGVVNIQTSNTVDTYIEKVKGLRFDKGYTSQYFITNPDKLSSELKDPYILITDHVISTIASIQRVLEHCAANHRPLLIISDGVDGEALIALLVNQGRGTLKSCVVKAPNYGDKKVAELEDIAAVTGGTFVNSQMGMKLEQITPDMLGECESVLITATDTTIVKGKGTEEAINERIKMAEALLENAETDYHKGQYKGRIAKLKGGVAILYVGAPSEMELNEKKDRIDDALCACRAANEMGYLPGGGIAYINAAMYLERCADESKLVGDRLAGYKTLIEALKSPIMQIVDNGFGNNQGAFVVSKVINDKSNDESKFNYGYDAYADEYYDLVEKGIIDPTKVAVTAIKNASAIAGIYLTTGCILIDKKDKETVQ